MKGVVTAAVIALSFTFIMPVQAVAQDTEFAATVRRGQQPTVDDKLNAIWSVLDSVARATILMIEIQGEHSHLLLQIRDALRGHIQESELLHAEFTADIERVDRALELLRDRAEREQQRGESIAADLATLNQRYELLETELSQFDVRFLSLNEENLALSKRIRRQRATLGFGIMAAIAGAGLSVYTLATR